MNLTLKAIPWDEKIDQLSERYERRAAESLISLALVKEKVLSGEWDLWGVFSEEINLGVFVTRIAPSYEGYRELVVMFTMSEYKSSIKLSNMLLPLYEIVAKLKGAAIVRIHTIHKPIEEFLEKNGYHFQENIYIKKVE